MEKQLRSGLRSCFAERNQPDSGGILIVVDVVLCYITLSRKAKNGKKE